MDGFHVYRGYCPECGYSKYFGVDYSGEDECPQCGGELFIECEERD